MVTIAVVAKTAIPNGLAYGPLFGRQSKRSAL
jgi:hypothetical protein